METIAVSEIKNRARPMANNLRSRMFVSLVLVGVLLTGVAFQNCSRVPLENSNVKLDLEKNIKEN